MAANGRRHRRPSKAFQALHTESVQVRAGSLRRSDLAFASGPRHRWKQAVESFFGSFDRPELSLDGRPQGATFRQFSLLA